MDLITVEIIIIYFGKVEPADGERACPLNVVSYVSILKTQKV
jgi:hypothetical protein